MSQSESKSKGSSLLMPLAIGGGLLLLFMGMKKANAKGGTLPALPEMDNSEPSLAPKQIMPEAAPKYTDLMEDDEADESQDEPSSQSYTAPKSSSQNYNALPTTSFNEDEEEASNGGGYRMDNAIPKSNSATKWNERQVPKIIGNGKPKMGMQQYSDQNRKFAERSGIINPKVAKINSMRSYSDQAKLAQQKARNNSPIKSPIPFIAQAQKAITQSKVSPKIFPLKQGQTNNYIKEVQRKMGVSPTGFFGTQTRAALLKKYKVTEISEALYKQIMTGKATVAKPIIPLKKIVPQAKRPIKIIRKK